MDITSAINAARKAGFVAIEQTFLRKFPAHQWQGILLKPGEMVLSREAFIQFVQNGCKEPGKYAKGTGFQSVLNKHIDNRLAELYEAQRPFVTSEEMEQYPERRAEIDYLEEERLKIQAFLDSLTPERA
jgi:hypothetical protein